MVDSILQRLEKGLREGPGLNVLLEGVTVDDVKTVQDFLKKHGIDATPNYNNEGCYANFHVTDFENKDKLTTALGEAAKSNGKSTPAAKKNDLATRSKEALGASVQNAEVTGKGIKLDFANTEDLMAALNKLGDALAVKLGEKSAKLGFGNGVTDGTNVSVTINPEALAPLLKIMEDSKNNSKAQSKASAEVESKKTTAAATVKAGGVGVVGKGSQTGLNVGIDNQLTIRGNRDYKIMQGKDGKMTAIVDLGEETQVLKSTDTNKQQITATLDGVDGKPARKVTFEVGKDGTLTEVKAPAATPKGEAKSVEPQR